MHDRKSIFWLALLFAKFCKVFISINGHLICWKCFLCLPYHSYHWARISSSFFLGCRHLRSIETNQISSHSSFTEASSLTDGLNTEIQAPALDSEIVNNTSDGPEMCYLRESFGPVLPQSFAAADANEVTSDLYEEFNRLAGPFGQPLSCNAEVLLRQCFAFCLRWEIGQILKQVNFESTWNTSLFKKHVQLWRYHSPEANEDEMPHVSQVLVNSKVEQLPLVAQSWQKTKLCTRWSHAAEATSLCMMMQAALLYLAWDYMNYVICSFCGMFLWYN